MSRARDAAFPLPLGPGRLSQAERKGEATHLTVAQSNVIGNALKRSRQRWLAPPPTYGSAPFTTLLTRFSSTSRGRNVAVVRQPPHRIQEVDQCDIRIGPHVFQRTKFFIVTWEYQQPPPQPRPAPPQARPQPNPASSGPALNRTGGAPSSLAKSSHPLLAGQRPGSSQQPGSAGSETYAVTPALIAALNTAARRDATLASHLVAAGNGTASPETLQALGKYIRAVQAELAKDAAKRASGQPSPNPGDRPLPSPSPAPSAGPSGSRALPAQSHPKPPSISTPNAASASAAQSPAPLASAPLPSTSNASLPARPSPAPASSSDMGGSATLDPMPASRPPPISSARPGAQPFAGPPEGPRSPSSPEGGGRVRKPTLKKLEADEGEQAYSAATHRPHTQPTSTGHPKSAPTSAVSGIQGSGGFWNGPGKIAIVVEFAENATERWLVPPWALFETRIEPEGEGEKEGGATRAPDVVLSFFGPPERVGELPKSAFRPPEKPKESATEAASKEPAVTPASSSATTTTAPSTDAVHNATSAAPIASAPTAGASEPHQSTATPAPETSDRGPPVSSAPSQILAPVSQPTDAHSSSSVQPASLAAVSQPAPTPLRLPVWPLHPVSMHLVRPSETLVQALTRVSGGLGWSDEEKEAWFLRQWEEGGCRMDAKEGKEVEVLQWKLPKTVTGPLAELVQGVDLVAERRLGARGKRRGEEAAAAAGVDLFAIPASGTKRKRQSGLSTRGKRASGVGRGGKRRASGVATPQEGSATPVPSAEGAAATHGSLHSPSVATSQSLTVQPAVAPQPVPSQQVLRAAPPPPGMQAPGAAASAGQTSQTQAQIPPAIVQRGVSDESALGGRATIQ